MPRKRFDPNQPRFATRPGADSGAAVRKAVRGAAGRRARDRVIVAVATPLGALLVIAGQVGARTGWITIPFDPHHIISQIVGFALLILGLTRWR